MTRLGTVLSLPDLGLAESAASAFDVVWLDLEHGALTVADAQALTIAVQGAGAEAHVRLPRWDSELASAVLDAGIDGVVAPRIDTAADAVAFARRLRLPPRGDRGFGPRRAGGYGRAAELPQPVCTVQIESGVGVDAAAAIAQVEGVDALVVGCADLALALGVSPEPRSPALRRAIERVAAAAEQGGADFGVATGGDAVAAAAMPGRRPDLLVFSVDVRLYARAVDAAVQSLTGALEEQHAPA